MKWLCLLFFAFLQLSVRGQNYRFGISTNLANIVVGGPSLALSYDASTRFSYQIYVSQGKFNHLPMEGSYKFKTAIVEMKYRFWEILYIGPYVRYIQKRVKREGYVDNTGFVSVSERDFYGEGLSTGLTLGGKPEVSERVVLEIFAGLGAGRFIKEIEYSHPNEFRSNFPDARVGVLIGFKW